MNGLDLMCIIADLLGLGKYLPGVVQNENEVCQSPREIRNLCTEVT